MIKRWKNKKRLTFEKEAHFIVLVGRRMGLLIQGNKFKFLNLQKNSWQNI